MKIAPFLLLVLLLVSVGVNIWQGKETAGKESEIAKIQRTLDKTQEENDLLSSTNQILVDKVAILQDSIDVLNKEIQELGRSLRSKVREVKSNRKKIADLQARSNALLDQINKLKSTKTADAERIKGLEDERLNLDVKLGDLFVQNDSLNSENTGLLEQLVDSETMRDSLEGQLTDSTFLANITDFDPSDPFKISPNKISVFFNKVEPLQKTNKEAPNPKKWNATKIEFQLAYNNRDVARLVNHNFVLQILDEDTGEIISPRESSSGSNDTKGLEFTFAKNPVSVQYVNYQKKKGANYIVQLSYLDRDGKQIVLPTGIKGIKFAEK